MENKKLEIEIPEGKQPKMTTSDNGVHVEWVDKEKTWKRYVLGYRAEVYGKYGKLLVEIKPPNWPKIFKFGLLQYIADDLNEERLDWENKNQGKYVVFYRTDGMGVSFTDYTCFHIQSALFTRLAAQKAIDIIPAEFLKTF